MNEQGVWANRFDKLRELVASVTNFSSCEDEVGDYTQFLETCVQTLDGLKNIKPTKKIQDQENNRNKACPREFVCPLSMKIMVDPVVVSSGQTYDRQSIVEWLRENRRCPKTQDELDGSIMLPNVLVREMIMVWTSRNSGDFHGPLQFSDNGELTEAERINLIILLEKVSSVTSPDRRIAAHRLRALTLYRRSHRLYFCESPESISLLVRALLLEKNKVEGEFEEDLFYTLSYIALHDSNRVVLGETPMLIALLVGGLKPERSQTIRSRAACTLRMLSYVESNQKLMGEEGAVKAFLDVLERGDMEIWRDAVNCLCKLCESDRNIQRVVAEGGLEIISEKISKRQLVMDLVYLLEMITKNEMAVIMWARNDGIQLLTSLLLDDAACWGTKEGCLGCLDNMWLYSCSDMAGDVDVIQAICYCMMMIMGETAGSAIIEKAQGLLRKMKEQQS